MSNNNMTNNNLNQRWLLNAKANSNTKGSSDLNANKIRSPLTGRWITIGGPTYQECVKRGYLIDNNGTYVVNTSLPNLDMNSVDDLDQDQIVRYYCQQLIKNGKGQIIDLNTNTVKPGRKNPSIDLNINITTDQKDLSSQPKNHNQNKNKNQNQNQNTVLNRAKEAGNRVIQATDSLIAKATGRQSQDVSQMISNLASGIFLQIPVRNHPVFSPFSIFYAMVLVYLGCLGTTKDEIRSALKINMTDDALINELVSWKEIGQTQSPVKFINSNILLIMNGYQIEQQYNDIFTKISGGQIVPFNNPQDAVQKANKWVAGSTNNLIKALLGQGDVTPDLRAVLINAVYFRAKWLSPFKAENSYERQFNGIEVSRTLNFMHNTGSYGYYEDENAQYLELLYADKNYSMRFMLPKKSINKFKPETVTNAKMKVTQLDVALPKFEHRQKYNLVNVLKKMGINTVFTDSADMSLISEQDHLHIDKIIHEAVVNVNEEGTEAAAATAVVMVTESARPQTKPAIQFTADHTFYYELIYVPKKLILFNGIFDG